VELHEGRVAVASGGEGKGSEFCVLLPAADGVRAAPVAAVERSPAARTMSTRVLIVDDNEDALELMAEALRHAGYEAHTAPDAATALVRADESTPDIVLLDIGLPVMDGYELAQRLRELPDMKRAKLVALTGYGQAADKLRAQKAGFDGHLVKPISMGHLEETLARMVERAGAS
jgi:CheY-like chemotaxis protein